VSHAVQGKGKPGRPEEWRRRDSDIGLPERPLGVPAEIWELFLLYLRSRTPTPSVDEGTLKFGDQGEQVGQLQRRLTELDYHTGGIDRIYGTLTRRAVAAFQVENELEGTGIADPQTRAALMNSTGSRFAPGREGATASDLRRLNSQEVINADRVRYTSWATGGVGLLGLLQSFLGARPAGSPEPAGSPGLGTVADAIMPILSGIVPGGVGGSLLMLALGLGGNLFGNNIIGRRVQLQRDGRHIGSVGQ
jgi:hypothetical protein